MHASLKTCPDNIFHLIDQVVSTCSHTLASKEPSTLGWISDSGLSAKYEKNTVPRVIYVFCATSIAQNTKIAQEIMIKRKVIAILEEVERRSDCQDVV